MNDLIVIGFSTSSNRNSLVSAAIRAVERTPYSHVYMRFWSDSIERWLVYHASHTNIHFNNIETFHEQNVVLDEYEVRATTEQRKDVLQLCVDRVGWPYGTMQLVGMGYVRLTHAWTGLKVPNPFSDGERTQVCSELAGHVLYKLGAPIDLGLLEYEGPRYIHDTVEKMVELGAATKRAKQ